ncbi:Aldehyde dehydrogenase family protein [Pseudomonas syringae]|uniref:Aldehyde dehydrogenase family protein n=1 Tax=Pseudomonas petroselini TaxID=2899822 RepID=A0ABS8R1M0_9PSED|nr:MULTISPECIES: aldehyde dehydrogenase family protein [Pseudomonas]MCD7041879.1 aldehyde dehydrogenase family protein [Pseudomonas petroselini]MCD7044051.1 aldehyde dehydrogenase family protein [Pseudomonas petroselini]MCD7067256.1 aldehyde dehydrogenase family protein [Pseudomonas petroselini]MCD7080435.1 aldehyde dehydrogenase family protein [Pseudomonas petroselini]MCM2380873.1 aldehyde dehydrogenase family protein [Pseudomonas marginalis]
MNKAQAELESVFPTRFPLAIDGELIQTLDRGQVINPATESVLADYPKASKHEFEAAIAAAKKAFGPWSRLTWGER